MRAPWSPQIATRTARVHLAEAYISCMKKLSPACSSGSCRDATSQMSVWSVRIEQSLCCTTTIIRLLFDVPDWTDKGTSKSWWKLKVQAVSQFSGWIHQRTSFTKVWSFRRSEDLSWVCNSSSSLVVESETRTTTQSGTRPPLLPITLKLG